MSYAFLTEPSCENSISSLEQGGATFAGGITAESHDSAGDEFLRRMLLPPERLGRPICHVCQHPVDQIAVWRNEEARATCFEARCHGRTYIGWWEDALALRNDVAWGTAFNERSPKSILVITPIST